MPRHPCSSLQSSPHPVLHAQPDTKTPPFNGIAHVALRVKNLAASVDFYEKLGFEQAFDLRKDNIPYESFIKINDTQFIELHAAAPTEHQYRLS